MVKNKAYSNIIFFSIGAIALLLDLITKYIVVLFLNEGQSIPVINGYFNITLVYNRGVAFGFLSDLNPNIRIYILTFAISLTLIFLLYLFFVSYREDVFSKIFISLILGGALGNIIDRFQYGYVIDFLDVYYKQYHWPAFNMADSFICIGTFLLMLRILFTEDKDKNKR